MALRFLKRKKITIPLVCLITLTLIGVGGYAIKKHRRTRQMAKPLPAEVEPNDRLAAAQPLDLPAQVEGTFGELGDVDLFRFRAEPDNEIGARVTVPEGAALVPVLTLLDIRGNRIRESAGGALDCTCSEPGEYILVVRDLAYRAAPDLKYRLEVGDVPVVTAVYPLGLQRGTTREVEVSGPNLGGSRTVRVEAPADPKAGSRVPIVLTALSKESPPAAEVVGGEFPEVCQPAGAPISDPIELPIPGTANGRIGQPGATNLWKFRARQGETLVLEVEARRLGSQLDSYIEILDGQRRPVPRAFLRCLTRTVTNLTVRNCRAPNFVLDKYNDLKINDLFLVGNEVLRIRSLPNLDNPPVNLFVYTRGKGRDCYLDTTPTHHGKGTVACKVEVHPPGTVLPPNGFPVLPMNYYNDDGGGKLGKDSRLTFDPPADGEYLVRIGDTRGEGGKEYAYRLTARRPRPGFTLSLKPANPVVSRGSGTAVVVQAERIDGFDGPIDIQLANVPAGFVTAPTRVAPYEDTAYLGLWAEPGATLRAEAGALRLIGKAEVNGREMVREVKDIPLQLAEPGEIRVRTAPTALTLRPGGQVSLEVAIERQAGFDGDVPIEVRGLPAGAWVQGGASTLLPILILAGENRRSIVFCAENEVPSTTQSIVVVALNKAKKTEQAARPITLTVPPPAAP